MLKDFVHCLVACLCSQAGALVLLVSCANASSPRKFTRIRNPTDPSVARRRDTGVQQPKSFHGLHTLKRSLIVEHTCAKGPLRRSAGLEHPEATAQSLASSRASGASYRAELSEHNGSQPNQQ